MNLDRVMPRSWLALACLAGAFTFLGAAIAYAVIERADAPPDAGSTDVGFLQDMITHHEQARALSYSELENGASDDVKVFAREIIQQQSYEIGLMDRMLDEWGYARENRPDTAMEWMGMSVAPQQMPGMASPSELQALEDAQGDGADALFLALMRDHHLGGVNMANAAAESAAAVWVRDLATVMARNQALEIDEMDAARDRAGLTDAPAGYEPGPFADMSDMPGMSDASEMSDMNSAPPTTIPTSARPNVGHQPVCNMSTTEPACIRSTTFAVAPPTTRPAAAALDS